MRKKLAVSVIGITATVVVASAGMAVAAYSGVASSGQIHACWNNAPGGLRIVDHFPCKSGETPLSWNQKGVRGDVGPAGAPGAVGADGATGAAGAAGDTGAAGPTGEGATGPRGPAGVDGAAGASGAPGEQGEQGVPGTPGAEGPAGQDASGSGLSVYAPGVSGALLGTLTSATRSQVHYLDGDGVVRSATPQRTVTRFMFSEPGCQGTAFLYQGDGDATDFRVDADIFTVAAGTYARTGAYASRMTASQASSYGSGNLASCSDYANAYVTAPMAATTLVSIR